MVTKRFSADLEYKRNPKLCKDAVRRILDWACKQPHLPNIEEEDAILFLASCLYVEESAQSTIEKYYTFKLKHPELLSNRDPLDPKSNFLNLIGCDAVMPGATNEGYKVLYSKVLQDCDESKMHVATQFKYLISQLELMLYEEGAVPGWRIVYDMEYAKARTILRVSPYAVKNLSEYFQEASPLGLVGMHIIHPKPMLSYILNITKPFLKTSVSSMINVHTNVEEIYQYIPKKCLPSDCGGELPSTKHFSDDSRKKIIANRDILIRNESLRLVEALRPRQNVVKKSFWMSFWG